VTEDGIQYIRQRCAAATANGLSIATSMFDTLSWPTATDGLQEFGNNKTNIPSTCFRKVLIGDGKG